MVLKIAKAELRNLFYSPVAWFLLIAFLVQCGWFYTSILYTNANWQDIIIRNNPKFKEFDHFGFTRLLFFGQDGVFFNVLNNLYLFIPLLTMGLIGKEVQSGTIKLLYSSPVKLRQIIMGKYLAIMLYNLMLVLIVGIFFVTAAFNVRSVDYGMLLSALLGFYLLTCAYTAIGAFMSSLTTYQIVAALGTFLIIFGLTHIGSLWQRYDFVRDLTYFLFLSGRTEKMLVGLITTKDVIYFLVVICIFLGFTLLKLKSAREIKPWYVKSMRYVAVLACGLLVGYISSRPILTGYWDTTAQKLNTIHEKTQKIIRELGEEELEVTLYTNLLGEGMTHGLPEYRNSYLTNMWEPYLRFKPGIKFNYVYYRDYDSTIQGNVLLKGYPGKTPEQIAQKICFYGDYDLSDWLKPEEIQKQINLKPEKLRTVMQLKYKGRTEFLRTFNDTKFWPDEFHVAAVFNRLLHPDAPGVGFITGHYERNTDKKGEREYRDHSAGKESRLALINLGFNVDTIPLETTEIPAGITTLVLADPKSALSPACQEKIRQYIDKGGNMMILGEPGKQQMVNPVLAHIGLKLKEGRLLQQLQYEVQDNAGAEFNNDGRCLLEHPELAVFKKMPVLDRGLTMTGTATIAYKDTNGFKASPILEVGNEISWVKIGPYVRDSARVFFHPEEGDYKGELITGVALHRMVKEKDQRIIVCGDADFLANRYPMRQMIGIRFYSWLANGVYPILLERPDPPDRRLTVTGPTAATLKIIYVWVLPALLLLAGTILLIRRKRK